MDETIRILIVDDHPVVRDGLENMLRTQAGFEVVGQAADGREAVEMAAALEPEVVLLDLEMPELDGVEALGQMLAASPELKVIVFTVFDTDERIVASVQAGASGYLLKGAPRDEIFAAIRVVREGGSLLQPVVASKLMQHMTSAANDEPSMVEALTEREGEVLGLLAQGMTNKEMAATLVISERTVKFHVSSILGKLGAGNRTEAVSIAVQRGLVEL